MVTPLYKKDDEFCKINYRGWGRLGLVTWESKRVSPSSLNRRGREN